jgi:hypothetical protein
MMRTHTLVLVDDDVFMPGEVPFPMALYIADDERPTVVMRRSDYDRNAAAAESKMWKLLAEQAYFGRRPAVQVWHRDDGSIGGVVEWARHQRRYDRRTQA